MSKMSTDPIRHALNGPTMGTRWSALFFAPPGFDPRPGAGRSSGGGGCGRCSDVHLEARQRPDAPERRAGGRMARYPPLIWRACWPWDLTLAASRAGPSTSGRAMRCALGALVPPPPIRRPYARRCRRHIGPRMTCWSLTATGVRKIATIPLDLNGIAKGYGVDRLVEVLRDHGIRDALVGIDGEARPWVCARTAARWTIAVEAPERARRAPHSILTLQDAAVATSGDYRHWVGPGPRSFPHDGPKARRAASRAPGIRHRDRTHLRRGRRLGDGPDGEGCRCRRKPARRAGLDALFLKRDDAGGVQGIGVGTLFSNDESAASAPAVGV